MPSHEQLHRRHRRAPNPDAILIAEDLMAKRHAAPVPAPVVTLQSVVYVTASKTFPGEIGGYVTPGATSDAAQTPDATPTPSSTPEAQTSDSGDLNVDTSNPTPKSSAAKATSSTGTDLPSAISSPTGSLESAGALLAATGGISSSASATLSTTASAASSSSSSAAKTSGGMSVGGKVGLAIGILLLVGAILTLVLFAFKKRKDAVKEAESREKQDPFSDEMARQPSVRTNPNAPRLSLRPVTEFHPNLVGERRQSRGNALMTAGATPLAEKTSLWERPMTGQSDRANPFGNHAEAIDPTNANGAPIIQSPTENSVLNATAAGAPIGTAIGTSSGLTRKASKLENGPKPMDFTRGGPFMGPPSPAGTEFSMNSESASSPTQTASGAAIAAAGGPANSTVHRVQLDFKPSMEDELELRAGQLIRLLHEYDDGWALCIRLDRSQQGVVPRTCLSTRPVKPRPQQNSPRGNPPPGMRVPQQGRPASPSMNNGPPRSASPASNRPMTSSSQQSSPSGSRGPMAPNGQGRPRSPSAAQMQGRRNSPPGPSRMNPGPQFDLASSPPGASNLPARKPVPGQAL